jgi:hypothetical protein
MMIPSSLKSRGIQNSKVVAQACQVARVLKLFHLGGVNSSLGLPECEQKTAKLILVTASCTASSVGGSPEEGRAAINKCKK